MPTKEEILNAAVKYANTEVELTYSGDRYLARRESIQAVHLAWNELEKLVTEATEGPF